MTALYLILAWCLTGLVIAVLIGWRGSTRLNKAPEQEGTSDVMSDENRKKAQIRDQIISEYGSYIEKKPPGLEFRDVSELPYSKEQILDAITLEIMRENNDQRAGVLKACAGMLADFQENVGPTAVTMLGISNAELFSAARRNQNELMDLAVKMAENPDKEKYESLKRMAEDDLVRIQGKLMAAEELRRQLPEVKKRQILG